MNIKDKIIALDIDGTITPDCTIPSQETCNQIKRLIDDGYNIILITGRGYATIKDVYESCGMNTFCVVFNGSYVFNPMTKEVIKNEAFEKDYLRDLLNDPVIVSCIDDMMIEQDEYIYSLNGHNCYSDKPMPYKPLQECLSGNVYCINTKVKEHSMHKEIENIVSKNENFGYRYWNYLGEIYNKNITKKDGAEALLKHFNKSFKDLIFIGDSDNDLELLKAAHIGVAMKNATKHAKECADEITKYDVYENGAIKHLLEMINER